MISGESVVKIRTQKSDAFTLGLGDNQALSFHTSLSVEIFSTPVFLGISQNPESVTAGAPVPVRIHVKFPCRGCGKALGVTGRNGGAVCFQCGRTSPHAPETKIDFFAKELKAFIGQDYSPAFLDPLLPRMEAAQVASGSDHLSASLLARETLTLLGQYIHEVLSCTRYISGDDFKASWVCAVEDLIRRGSAPELLALARTTRAEAAPED